MWWVYNDRRDDTYAFFDWFDYFYQEIYEVVWWFKNTLFIHWNLQLLLKTVFANIWPSKIVLGFYGLNLDFSERWLGLNLAFSERRLGLNLVFSERWLGLNLVHHSVTWWHLHLHRSPSIEAFLSPAPRRSSQNTHTILSVLTSITYNTCRLCPSTILS